MTIIKQFLAGLLAVIFGIVTIPLWPVYWLLKSITELGKKIIDDKELFNGK